jgi:uncharacterized membrane protein YbhN (UPF0104 family)
MFRLIGALLSRLARGKSWQGLVERGDTIDSQVQALYARRGAVLANASYTFVCWLFSAGEVWIALYALGIRGGFAEACILESVSRAIRSGTFVIPGALGVQEGGYVVVGGLLGIAPDAAMELALIRRARELAVGIPGLIVWHWVEGKHWWRRRADVELPTASAP